MAWYEETLIQPEAWSPRVEWDLLDSVYAQAGERTRLRDRVRHAKQDWTVDEVADAQTFEADFAAACAEAKKALDTNAGAERPYVHSAYKVVLKDTGVDVALVDLGELPDEQRHFRQMTGMYATQSEAHLLSTLTKEEREKLIEWRLSGGATAPAFASGPAFGSGLVPATLDTSLTAPTNVTTLLTGVAAGTKIEEVVLQGVGTTVAGVVNLFLYDGSTYHLHDQALLPAVTSSTTAVAYRSVKQYTNLILKDNTWSYRASVTIAGDQSIVKVSVTAGVLT